MTTIIENSEDFLRAMRENDEFRLAARRELLSEELLALPQRFAEYSQTTDRKLDRLSDNIGEVKGPFMERAAREDAPIIASEMGLVWKKSLERNEVVEIADEANRKSLASGVSRDNMRTFRRADLVIEAVDDGGRICYIAVEISYTADSRDTIRAIRHAEFLTRFTGIPAYAAISSVHIDNRIKDILTEDSPTPLDVNQETKVFWSRLPELEPPE